MMRFLVLAGTFAAIIFSGSASAQVTVPYTFTAGAPARAAEVNADFQALVTAINGLGTRVSKLEGNLVAADFVGTYTLNRFQTELGGGASAYVAVYTAGGTITLAADGTATTTGTGEQGHQLNVVTRALTPFNTPPDTGSVTWSYSGGRVTVPTYGISFAVADGGRLLIATSVNPADGTNVLLLLTRTD